MTPQEQAFAQLTGGTPPPGVSTEGADAAFEQLTGRKPSPSADSATAPPVPTSSTAARRTRDIVGGAADVVDLLIAGTPALVGGAFSEAVNRVQGVFDGRSRKQIAEEGAAQSAAIGEKFGTPVRSALTSAGYLRKDEPGAVQKGMEAAMGLLERDAAAVEERTGGKVLKQDYMMFVNGLFAMAGVAGTGIGTKTVLSNAKAKLAAKELDRMVASRQAENTIVADLETAGDAAKTTTPVRDAGKAPLNDVIAASQRDLATPEAQRKAERARRRADVRAAFAEDPYGADATAKLAEGDAERRAVAEAEQGRLSNRGEMAPRTRAPEAIGVDEASRILEERRAVVGQDVPPYIQRPSGVLVPNEATPKLETVAPGSLESGLAKVSRGRAFDLTAEERIAIRGSRQVVDPKIVTAAAVGATGLGLAMALEPDAEEAALAIGAGALVVGRGKGLTLDAIRKMPDASPLGAILEPSAYTLNTLEILNKQAPGRFEFKKTAVEQLLKRPEVTGAERTVIETALATVPGETITAKQLMAGVKEATGDFELKAKPSDEYASYGLENIDRLEAPDDYRAAQMAMEDTRVEQLRNRIDQALQTAPNPDGTRTIRGFGRLERVDVDALEVELATLQGASITESAGPPATTRIWQSPVELGTNNHFGDPNYFAHTRSFEEGGVRHVVELQSDYAQKTGKVLTPEERTKLEGEHLAARERYVAALQWNKMVDGGEASAGARKVVLQPLREKMAELQAKLTEAQSVAQVGPMLKNWHKRLIREEIADAARGKLNPEYAAAREELKNKIRYAKSWEGPHTAVMEQLQQEVQADAAKLQAIPEYLPSERVIRFADADTVAKVEGWPTKRGAELQELLTDIAEERRLINHHNRGEELARMEGRSYKDHGERAAAEGRIVQIQKEQAQLEAGDHRPIAPQHQGIYDRYAGDVTKFLKQLGGKHIKDSAGHGWWEVPLEGSKQMPAGKRVQQFGGVDPKLAAGIVAIGGGAYLAAVLSEENKTRAAIIGGAVAGLAALAVGGHPGVRSWAKAVGHTAEIALGNTSTTVRGMSMPLLRRMTTFEWDVLKRTHDRVVAVAPFAEGFRKLADGPTKAALRSAVTSNDSATTLRLLGQIGDPKLIAGWREVRRVLDEVGAELQAIGRLEALRPDYFPRMVVDHEGLLNSLGLDLKTGLEKILVDANRASQVTSGLPLSALERTKLINKYLAQHGGTGKGRPGFLKQRKIGDVDEALSKFYAPPDEAILLYLRGATKEIEQAKFFGRNAVRDPATGRMALEASVGNVVEAELTAGRIKPEQAEQLRQILRDRHGPGEKAMDPKFAAFRDLTNMGLLGNAFSALVQTGDIAVAVAAHGLLPTVNSVLGKLTKRPGMTKVSDLGLINHISEEMATTSRTAKWLNQTFKLAGFSYIDQMGKSIAVNAAREKWRGKLRTPEGERAFRREYEDYFGRDMDALVRDLRANEPTRLVNELLFRELSDLQPISKLETPQLYLRHPNARLFYMLKTFMLKQADIFRRKVVQQAMKGDRLGAVNNTLRFGLALGASGATTQFINNLLLGREDKLEWGDVAANVFRTFGYSEYAMSKPNVVDKVTGTVGQVLPPYKMWAEVATADPKSLMYLPLVGRLLHNRGELEVGDMKLGGGAAKYNTWQERKAEREAAQ